jgi:hypothetical protein
MLTATACDRASGPDPSNPDAYAVRLPLAPAPRGTLQRLALPPEALVALRRPDLGDIRLFDARGKVVPIALIDGPAGDRHDSISVPVYPIVGPAGALGKPGLSIRIEDNRVARVVTVDTPSPPAGGAAASAVLLDTRAVRDPATAIVLDAEMPAGTPVALTLFSSADLRHWDMLAEKVLFRPAAGSALLGGATVALPGIDLHDRYVGIGWARASGVSLKAVRVLTSTVAPPARIAVGTSAMALTDAHALRFDLPDMARLGAIRLTGAGPDGVIPVRLYGRDRGEDPWIPLAAATLRPGEGATLDLSGPPLASYRLEADRRTAGFSTQPRVELLFDPVELLVAPSGTPPYRLAVGQAAAPATFLTLAEIAPRGGPLDLATLPRATVVAQKGARLVVALEASASDGALEPRKLLLWAALLLGTLVLAFAAMRLARQPTTPSATTDE